VIVSVSVVVEENDLAHPRLEALTHDAIVQAAKNLAPGDIRKWSVVVDGREFPVKQLVREAANQLQSSDSLVTPADLTAHDAVRYLRKHGFADTVRYQE
jgi:hypothetical protein